MRKIATIFSATILTALVLSHTTKSSAQTPQPAPAQPAATTAPAVSPAPAPQPITPPLPTGDPLIDKLNTKKFQMATYFVPTSQMHKMSLKKSKVQAFQVQLPGPPFCHSYVVSGNDNVKNIDINVMSPMGAIESQDATMEGTAVIINHCPQMPGAYKLNVTMTDGKGEFAIQVFSK